MSFSRALSPSPSNVCSGGSTLSSTLDDIFAQAQQPPHTSASANEEKRSPSASCENPVTKFFFVISAPIVEARSIWSAETGAQKSWCLSRSRPERPIFLVILTKPLHCSSKKASFVRQRNGSACSTTKTFPTSSTLSKC